MLPLLNIIKDAMKTAKKIRGKVGEAKGKVGKARKYLGQGDEESGDQGISIGGEKYKTSGRIKWRSSQAQD